MLTNWRERSFKPQDSITGSELSAWLKFSRFNFTAAMTIEVLYYLKTRRDVFCAWHCADSAA
jgi:hypothetical protein